MSASEDLQALRIDRNAPVAPSSWKRWALILFVLGGAVMVSARWYWPKVEARVFKTRIETTEVVSVGPSQSVVELTSTGYVVPLISSKVSAKLSGRIARVFVKEGDRVKEGDKLFELDSADQRAQLASFKARMLTAQARAQSARATLSEIAIQTERQRKLVKSGAMGEASLIDLEAKQASLEQAVHVADAEANAAKAEVEAISINLKNTTIIAPISGEIITKPAQVGETAGFASVSISSEPLVEIADMNTLVVETDVPENRRDKIHVGGPCEIALDAFGAQRFRGQVHEIRPKVNRSKATLAVRVKFIDNVEGVLPDMAARVSFLDKALDETSLKQTPKTVVPKSALVQKDGRSFVFVIEKGAARKMDVTLGEPLGDGYELKGGPEVGTRLVRNPPSVLTDGSPVEEKSE